MVINLNLKNQIGFFFNFFFFSEKQSGFQEFGKQTPCLNSHIDDSHKFVNWQFSKMILTTWLSLKNHY
jgi:hypothetical protein